MAQFEWVPHYYAGVGAVIAEMLLTIFTKKFSGNFITKSAPTC